MFDYAGAMQLRLDAADRLVELVEERRGSVPADEAARALFALASAPVALARSLLEDTVRSDARLVWRGDLVGLAAAPGDGLPLDAARFVVVDLETTGLSPGVAQICEIGAVRIEALLHTGSFETLANPGRPLAPAVSALTGIHDRELRRAPPVAAAVRRFLAFAGDAVLVAHNARFDLAFLDREVERLTGRRLAVAVVDTVGLARRLVGGRCSLAELAYRFGTAARPCHRALPDAEATGEILLRLIGLAQERGAETVFDLCELAATRTRRVHCKRSLAFGAPERPGVYLFRDAHDQVLYVGRARDLRARLRSYFRSERQRPAVEAALGALERIEWRVLGSELEAGIEELRLLRELHPPANARGARPDRYVYLHRRGERIVVSAQPSPWGPIASRRKAELAARALQGFEGDELAAALPPLEAKLARLARDLRYEDAARLRDRIAALEAVTARIGKLERLRAARLVLVAPAAEPGLRRAFLVTGGRVAAQRTLAPHEPVPHAIPALAVSYEPEHADELLLVDAFLRHPSPELQATRLVV
jgi:DNA polymerase III epsilon subunit family exonuclease